MEESSFVVTGASSFLGKAFARALSGKKHHKVFLTSRSEVDFGELVNNDNVQYLPGIDLTNENQLNQFREKLDGFIKGPFHVINCLGYFPGYKAIEETGIGDAKKVFDSNVTALYNVAASLLPLMCSRGGGHFIGFSTHTGYQHYPEMVAFTAAKAAVESLIKGIANEYLSKGINANTIALATMNTSVEIEMKPSGDVSNWLNPEEVCRLVYDIIMMPNRLMNGNVIHIYKYSETYFHQSYYDRIRNA